MNPDLVMVALLAGVANWAFRALPTLLMTSEPKPGGLLARFLAATGPAAIATLFTASILPQLWPVRQDLVALLAGIIATTLAFLPRRSVVLATMAGALAYGLAFWLTSASAT